MAIQKLGIIAGQGWLPKAIIDYCLKENIPFLVLAINGQTPADLLSYPHDFITYTQFGKTFKTMHRHNLSHIVMAGGMQRPKLSSLKPDARGLKMLARLGLKGFGDDRLLTALIQEIESEELQVIGAHDLLENLIFPKGLLTSGSLTAQQESDIALGLQVAKQIGALDIGQAVLVEEGQVIAVENIAGTQKMLEAMGSYCKKAILVKCAKPQQEERADLPSIGPDTITQAHKNNVAVVVGEGGKTLLLDSKETLARAKQYKITLFGA